MFTLLLGFIIAIGAGDSDVTMLTTFSPAREEQVIAQELYQQQPHIFPGVAVQAHAGVVIDQQHDRMLWERNADEPLPIASITKLMTALVFLQSDPDFEAPITVERADNANVEGSRLYVPDGEVVRTIDLFYTSLVGSANNATKALARSTGLSEEAFLLRMNAMASQLGMTQTKFYDVTGLDPRNVASAQDVAILATAAFAQPRIRAALQTPIHKFVTVEKEKPHTIHNTNAILDQSVIAKTGYLHEAGFTYVAQSSDGVLTVLLRQWSSEIRFQHALSLLQWGAQVRSGELFFTQHTI